MYMQYNEHPLLYVIVDLRTVPNQTHIYCPGLPTKGTHLGFDLLEGGWGCSLLVLGDLSYKYAINFTAFWQVRCYKVKLALLQPILHVAINQSNKINQIYITPYGFL